MNDYSDQSTVVILPSSHNGTRNHIVRSNSLSTFVLYVGRYPNFGDLRVNNDLLRVSNLTHSIFRQREMLSTKEKG